MAVGPGLVYKGQVHRGLFSVAISSIASRTCSVGRQVLVAFPTLGSQDIHLPQLPGRPAARSSSQDGSNENSVTWPATMSASRQAAPLMSLPGLFWAGLTDTPWQHRNKGPAREGFKCLTKVARKVSSSAFCFHNKSSGGISVRLLSFAAVRICTLPTTKVFSWN